MTAQAISLTQNSISGKSARPAAARGNSTPAMGTRWPATLEPQKTMAISSSVENRTPRAAAQVAASTIGQQLRKAPAGGLVEG